MRNECNIICDLLPLYIENVASSDSIDFVEEHLKSCPHCQQEYTNMKAPDIIKKEYAPIPLQNLKRRLFAKKIQTIILTAIIVIALLVSGFAALDSPEYFPYSSDLLTISEHVDNSITITFDKKVTDYNCTLISEQNNCRHYQIEAWTSIWDQLFSNRGIQSTTIPSNNIPVSVYYAQNNGIDPDVHIYGKNLTVNGGMITLPRLVLNYYLLIEIGIFFILLALRFVYRKKVNIKTAIERAIFYPIAYAVSHVIVMGFRTHSYQAAQDFSFIFFISILIYLGFLLALSIYRTKKESEEI